MTSKQDEVVRSPRTYDASVRRAQTPEQDDLVAHQEHCSADPRRLATVGAGRGAQVRIVRSDAEYALFTVSEVRPESPDTVVRMGKDSRERLGTPEEFSAVLDTRVARSELTDERARSGSEFVERLQDNGHQRRLVVLAPHGGDIEPHTDEQAEYLAAPRLDLRSGVCPRRLVPRLRPAGVAGPGRGRRGGAQPVKAVRRGSDPGRARRHRLHGAHRGGR
ncbi:MAG TPA: poly-gamma-glutamate hydrolase family protein [Pseudonocardiaceae bacterium]